MNVKKFAQDKAKKIKYQKFLKQNKENLYSVDDSKFKQFSVDLHKLSMDQEHPNRNITKEQISIFLENQSQDKTFNEKHLLELELRKFTKKLDENDGSVRKFLDSQLEDNDEIRTDEIKRLISVLAKKLHNHPTYPQSSFTASNTNPSSSCGSRLHQQKSFLLTQQSVAPYLHQQIQQMQQKLHQLSEFSNQYKEFKNIEKSQKEYIRHTLQSVYKRQLEEVQMLEEGNVWE